MNETIIIQRTNEMIKNNTNYLKTKKTAGIFALFVDYWEDKKICPIYVGQSESCYSRFSQHKRSIKKILDGKEPEEDDIIYVRIADFLRIHNLSIDFVKGVLLEEVDTPELLEELEDLWIQKLNVESFGFNRSEAIHYLRKIEAKVNYRGYEPDSFVLKNYLLKSYRFAISLLMKLQTTDFNSSTGFLLDNIGEILETQLFDFAEGYIEKDDNLQFDAEIFKKYKEHSKKILSTYNSFI